jgi:putative spermidine/putrescine transport system ATP-binding protein
VRRSIKESAGGVMTAAARSFKELRLEDVRCSFGSFNALRGISLTVAKGEFVALLGPSGCGKTTALNCIAGLQHLTSGSLWLDQTRIDHLKPEQRGFGMVFQNYALFPHMSVRRNVAFGLKMQRAPLREIERKVDDALSLVRLLEHGAQLPGRLSGGQQQRVAIARAIVVEPPLVLMDEPLSNLDAKLRLEMRGEIRRIHNLLGSTTLYVTHDHDEALSLADRVVVLRDGLVRQVGAPEALYRRPAKPDVAAFMGYRNILPCRLLDMSGDCAKVEVAGAVIRATAVEQVKSGSAMIAIRPDDLTPMAEGAISATVESAEYRGQDFYGVARARGGVSLFFRSRIRVEPGESVTLGAAEDRVLLYPEDELA